MLTWGDLGVICDDQEIEAIFRCNTELTAPNLDVKIPRKDRSELVAAIGYWLALLGLSLACWGFWQGAFWVVKQMF